MEIPHIVEGLAFEAIMLLGIIAVMSQVAWQVFIVSIPVIAACIWYQVLLVSLNTHLLFRALLQCPKSNNIIRSPDVSSFVS
jgi:hypothetical protein